MTGWDLHSFSLLSSFLLVAHGVRRYGNKTVDDFIFVNTSTVQRSLIFSICPACLHRVGKKGSLLFPLLQATLMTWNPATVQLKFTCDLDNLHLSFSEYHNHVTGISWSPCFLLTQLGFLTKLFFWMKSFTLVEQSARGFCYYLGPTSLTGGRGSLTPLQKNEDSKVSLFLAKLQLSSSVHSTHHSRKSTSAPSQPWMCSHTLKGFSPLK